MILYADRKSFRTFGYRCAIFIRCSDKSYFRQSLIALQRNAVLTGINTLLYILTYLTASNAAESAAIKSSAFSMPMERRIVLGLIP